MSSAYDLHFGNYAEVVGKFTTVPYVFNANPDNNHNAKPNLTVIVSGNI